MLGVAVSTVRSEGHAYGIELLEEGGAEYTGNGRLLDRVRRSVGSEVGMVGCVWSLEGIELVVLMGESSDGNV